MKGLRGGRGSILISTLWIMSILAVLAAGIGLRAGLDLRMSQYNIDRLRARYLALAAIASAEDLIKKNTNESYDSLNECAVAYADKNMLEMNNDGPAGPQGRSFKATVIDENRKFNINRSRNASVSIDEFRRTVRALSGTVTDDMIDSMLDWQEKNGDLDSLGELLLIKGVDVELLGQLKNDLTVYGSGKININTAGRDVLRAVVDKDGSYAGLADKIIAYRNDGDRHFVDLDNDIVSKVDLTPSEKARLESLRGILTTKSSCYMVIAEARSGNVARKSYCVIERGAGNNNSAGRIYYHEG